MFKKAKIRLIPVLLVLLVASSLVAFGYGVYNSGDSFSQLLGDWYTYSGGAKIGAVNGKFTSGGVLSADSVYASFSAGSGSTYTAKADLSMTHDNGVTKTTTMNYTSNSNKTLTGDLWNATNSYSVTFTENKTNGKVYAAN